MAHFAKLGVGGVVERVESVSDDIATTEQAGIDFLRELYKDIHSQWAQTYSDGISRKNYANIGFKYDQTRDAFIPPKPFSSWILNETTCLWEPPISRPQLTQEQIDNNDIYVWDENLVNWKIQSKA